MKKIALLQEAGVYLFVLLYILVFNTAVISSTVVFHEFGHFYLGREFACANARIILLDETLSTYTQMNCRPTLPNTQLYALELGGFLFVIPFALALWLLRGYERYYAFIVLGFNMMISLSDIGFLPRIYSYIFMLAGGILIVYGETLLINRYLAFIERLRPVILSYSNK